MNISCANCGSSYTLTLEQIAKAPDSVIMCLKCERRIKIAQCPFCKIYYSITYSSLKNTAYRLTCGKCKSNFVLSFNEFPIANELLETRDQRNSEISKINNNGRNRNEKIIPYKNKQSDSFTIRHLQETIRLAFLKNNLLISFIGLSIIIISSSVQYLLVSSNIIAIEKNSSIGNYSKLLNGMPIAVILFVYMLVSAIISWNYKNNTNGVIFSVKELLATIFRVSPLLLICNFMVFVFINSLLMLFIKIPTIGPLFFALLFLPIYILSIVTILLALIGFWFVPPIAVNGDCKLTKSVGRILRFVNKQKYSLVIVVPILFLVMSLFIFFVYSLHQGAYAVICYIAKSYAPEEFAQSFLSIPSLFIRLTEYIFAISDGGFNHFEKVQSAFTDITGVILGGILVIIVMIFYSMILSLTSLLAVRTYMLFESEEDISDVNKIRLLTILLLVLCLIIIIKKFIIL